MRIFQMYELMNFIINKDYEGNAFTPDQLADLVTVANLELFKIKMGLPEDYAPGQPYSRQGLDLTQRLTDETKFLKAYNPTITVASGVISYPSGYFTISALRHNYSRTIDGAATGIIRPIEILTEDEYSDRAGKWLKRPTTWDPVAVIRSDGIHVYPDSISSAEIAYIKYPAAPVFAYTLQPGYIEEDTVGTTEFEWPEVLHMDLVRIMLSFIGVHLRDEQLFQYAEQKKAAGV